MDIDVQDVDGFITRGRYKPPKGGEIIVQSAETFESLGPSLTEQEMAKKIVFAREVLRRWKEETPEQRAQREEFEARVKQAAKAGQPAFVALINDVLTGKA
jgi:hypothetical protein